MFLILKKNYMINKWFFLIKVGIYIYIPKLIKTTLYITEILKITCIFTCIPSILWINSFADSFFASILFQQKLFFYGVKLFKNLISLCPNILKIFFRYFTSLWRQPNFLLCEFCEITNDQILLRLSTTQILSVSFSFLKKEIYSVQFNANHFVMFQGQKTDWIIGLK